MKEISNVWLQLSVIYWAAWFTNFSSPSFQSCAAGSSVWDLSSFVADTVWPKDHLPGISAQKDAPARTE